MSIRLSAHELYGHGVLMETELRDAREEITRLRREREDMRKTRMEECEELRAAAVSADEVRAVYAKENLRLAMRADALEEDNDWLRAALQAEIKWLENRAINYGGIFAETCHRRADHLRAKLSS